MLIRSLKQQPALLKSAVAYCEEHWGSVSAVFSRCAELSVNSDRLPQTWLVLSGEKILGFYQLVQNDHLTNRTELTPFIGSLYVDQSVRGTGIAEMLLTHAKYEAAHIGYDRVYIATDHIGYYEKFGFLEIGSDVTDWGGVAKIYAADTPREMRFEIFSKDKPLSDELYLSIARASGLEIPENPASMLWRLKHSSQVNSRGKKHFTVVAFLDGETVGAASFMRDSDNAMCWYMYNLFVSSGYRRRGIAKLLTERGIERVRLFSSGGEYVCSCFGAHDEGAKAFHTAMGFTLHSTGGYIGENSRGEIETIWKKDL
ncbi:MAG: GNAT family N-acetyltransferase [Ruminococcaceae bacterium]|nr:GNAT family N-acetyltransferase [Oscillospiraceae bacterium]